MVAANNEQPEKPGDENLVPPETKKYFEELENLKATSQSGEIPLIEQVRNIVPIRKPSKEAFIRAHEKHRIDAVVVELKEEQKLLLVAPQLQGALLTEGCVGIRRLQLAVTATGVVFIWPLRLPNEGRQDMWATTALDAAAMAVDKWVRVTSNMALGGYQIAVARIDNEPKWPKESFNELLRIAFKGSVVDSIDHPVLKQLRGEI